MPIQINKNGEIIIERSADDTTVQQHLLRSRAVQELIARKPDLFVRMGIPIFCGIIVLMLALSWFIYYPDIVVVNTRLTSVNAPKMVVTRTSGKLVLLPVKEGALVKKDDVIAVMESAGNYADISALSRYIDTLRNRLANEGTVVPDLPASGKLGELQQPYQELVQASLVFRNYLSDGFYTGKKKMLLADLVDLQRKAGNLQEQQQIQGQDLHLTEQTFSATEQLKAERVISAMEYRAEKSKVLNKQLQLTQLGASLIDIKGRESDKKKELAELESVITQQQQIFITALNTFHGRMEEWKLKYVLTAPVGGRIAFTAFLEENQELPTGQQICYINPQNSHYYADTYLQQANFGKVKTGQDVLLKFSSYPSEEYGYLTGKITFISDIPTDSGYLARIVLPADLKTNRHKSLQYREGLKARGEIITKNRRLLERFFAGLVRLTRG